MLAQAIAAGLAAFTFAPSGTQVTPPSQPGPWKQIGKAPTSRLAARMHLSRTAPGATALAFVVTSGSPRRIQLSWSSYCEEQSDDGYTENYQGKLSAVGRITYYPHVFDGATVCYVWLNTDAIKGARVTAAVFSY
jgi:hypothetical protein